MSDAIPASHTCSDASPTPSLRAVGLKQTPQREALLKALEGADRPLTVEDIRSRMADRSGIPTIYRNLERFVQEGWAESILGQDQVMRFVRCRSDHHHHHVQCERCGRSVEVEACGLEHALAEMERKTGFRITRHTLNLFGQCPNCTE